MAKASRALLRRIRSVQNTRKITKTMELVSASKLRRASERVNAARPYAEALRDVLVDLLSPELVEKFPLLRQPAPPSKGGPTRAAVILVTSNRGLCGAFNTNLIKEARRRIAALESEGYTVDLYTIGKKGGAFFKFLGRKPTNERNDIGDKPTAEHAAEVAEPAIREFIAGQLGRVEFVHAYYNSPLSTPPTTTRVLPVEAPTADKTEKAERAEKADTRKKDYLLAPDAESILSALLPFECQTEPGPDGPMLGFSVRVLPSVVGELASRMRTRPGPIADAAACCVQATPLDPAMSDSAAGARARSARSAQAPQRTYAARNGSRPIRPSTLSPKIQRHQRFAPRCSHVV